MTSDHKDSAWERIENYVKEERPLQPIRKIVVQGSVDVVFRRSDKPMLIVAGETADAVASVKTDVNGGKLVIEREGMTISFGSSRMTLHGSVGSFVMGDIEAFVRSEVRARVAGSGDILVRGNPPHRDHGVAGSGKIKFR